MEYENRCGDGNNMRSTFRLCLYRHIVQTTRIIATLIFDCSSFSLKNICIYVLRIDIHHVCVCFDMSSAHQNSYSIL